MSPWFSAIPYGTPRTAAELCHLTCARQRGAERGKRPNRGVSRARFVLDGEVVEEAGPRTRRSAVRMASGVRWSAESQTLAGIPETLRAQWALGDGRSAV